MFKTTAVLILLGALAACSAESTQGGGSAGLGPAGTVALDVITGGDSSASMDGGTAACTAASECPNPGMICQGNPGVCTRPECPTTSDYCADQSTLVSCSDDSAFPSIKPCGPNQRCADGECRAPLCTPNATICQSGKPYQCDMTGTQLVAGSCAGGRPCVEGECRPIMHNVILLFDTSYSMNDCADGTKSSPDGCCSGKCPEEWPVCETADNTLSKLGASKQIFSEFFAELGAQLTTRFALMTFPQEELEFHSFCTSGYYSDRAKLPGDDDEHHSPAPPGGWLHSGLSQVVRVPFAKTWTQDNSASLLSWIDFVEDKGVNPELRCSGPTPLGRSMFYAGEYLKHYVVVDGKPCATDTDCGSVNYVCDAGSCRDPARQCRRNILLVFTDGEESASRVATDFYNPVVQARRMKFGLGCSADSDCLGGAACDESGVCYRPPMATGACANDNDCMGDAYCTSGICENPGFVWPTNVGTCSQTGNACTVGGSGDCAGFLEQCNAIDPKVDDGPTGSNRLVAYDGTSIEVTTHVINIDEKTTESETIADQGGGLHFGATLTSPDILKAILQRTADLKYGVVCESLGPQQATATQ